MKTKKAPDGWDKLESFLEQQAENDKPQQPDEFDATQYVEQMANRGIITSRSNATRKLNDLVIAGTLVMRKTNKNGKLTNIYKLP
jgi:hypothetical protein